MAKAANNKAGGERACPQCGGAGRYVFKQMQQDESWKTEVLDCEFCPEGDPSLPLQTTAEYTVEYVTKNAIPAKCVKCGRDWVGRDAIRSPSLACCGCWCGGKLIPHPDHVGQISLFGTAGAAGGAGL